MFKKIDEYAPTDRFYFGIEKQKKEFKLKSVGKRKVKFTHELLGRTIARRDPISKVNQWLQIGVLQEIKEEE